MVSVNETSIMSNQTVVILIEDCKTRVHQWNNHVDAPNTLSFLKRMDKLQLFASFSTIVLIVFITLAVRCTL